MNWLNGLLFIMRMRTFSAVFSTFYRMNWTIAGCSSEDRNDCFPSPPSLQAFEGFGESEIPQKFPGKVKEVRRGRRRDDSWTFGDKNLLVLRLCRFPSVQHWCVQIHTFTAGETTTKNMHHYLSTANTCCTLFMDESFYVKLSNLTSVRWT